METISLLENLGIKRKRDKCRLGDSKYGLNISYINMKDRVTLVNKVESKLEALKKTFKSACDDITNENFTNDSQAYTGEKTQSSKSFPPFLISYAGNSY